MTLCRISRLFCLFLFLQLLDYCSGLLPHLDTKDVIARAPLVVRRSAQSNTVSSGRRNAIAAGFASFFSIALPTPTHATENSEDVLAVPVQVIAPTESKQLFNEGRTLESQGNMIAAQRLYSKVTKISPRFIYGWSNLGNTQVALQMLEPAEESYSAAISLCNENLQTTKDQLGVRRCNDLYVLLLNRGALRLNNGRPKDALADLQQASILRERPDAVILQNLARAKELNGLFSQADRDYALAISMTANEVNPFWLRSAMVKFQLGDVQGGYDLLKRVDNRFPEAPEVRAAYACFLWARGDAIAAQRKFLEIPDRPRSRFVDYSYLTSVLSWPPEMIRTLDMVVDGINKAAATAATATSAS